MLREVDREEFAKCLALAVAERGQGTEGWGRGVEGGFGRSDVTANNRREVCPRSF